MDNATIIDIKETLTDVKAKITDLEKLINEIPVAPAPTPDDSTTGVKYHVWIYPGAPSEDAADTYHNNKIDVIRVEYFRLLPTGNLQRINEVATNLAGTKNAYSAANVKDIKAYSSEQLVTVSGTGEGIRAMYTSSTKITAAVNTLKTFVVNNDLTGIDIDFEGFGEWTIKDYSSYLNFLKTLGTALRSAGKKLAVCGANWTSGFDNSPYACGFNYKDFIDLPIDYVTPMMYDYQYDHGGGTPVTPLGWLTEWTDRLLKIFGPDRLVIGLPSYGYTATKGKWDIAIKTLGQIKEANGYDGGVRDSNGEVFKTVGTKVWVSNDKVSMNRKKDVVVSLGAKHISVWHAGGKNDWF